ncbi:putative ATPase YjoB [Anaerolineae bacterium]|nr:putative ATPase YjoB [Anaerolineae bacterium]
MSAKIPKMSFNRGVKEEHSRMLRYELLVQWASEQWELLYPGKPFLSLWASENVGNNRARSRIKPGRKLRGKVRFEGAETLDCPYVVPISDYRLPGNAPVLDESVGAWHFKFTQEGENFGVIFASSYYEDGDKCIVAVALIPDEKEKRAVWAHYETLSNQASRYLERSQRVYIIGGESGSFKPTVDWDQVILPDALKADLRGDMEAFFNQGVGIYKQLNLAPFRKLLLVGPPGTGKTTLCAALAKLALAQKRVVVYVSGADDDGATFRKIHHALNVVTEARHPVLLIVEEIDVYLRKVDKAQILNVLDGLESPNNPKGALLVATTNYPEVIDERIAKRPGRVDRIIHIPTIQDSDQAGLMLKRYMGPQWQHDHQMVVNELIGQTGAFVREIALYARMLAAHNQETEVTLEVLKQSILSLTSQLATGYDLRPKREMGFGGALVKRKNGAEGPD